MSRVVFLIVPYIMSRMFDKEVDIEGSKVDIRKKKLSFPVESFIVHLIYYNKNQDRDYSILVLIFLC